MPTPGKWQRYPDVRHRTPVRCAGCAATTREPNLFRWVWTRDASGFKVSRCARCLPITAGKSGDAVFGMTAVQRGAARGAAATRAKRQAAAEEDRDG